jgi:hypothetical protein
MGDCRVSPPTWMRRDLVPRDRPRDRGVIMGVMRTKTVRKSTRVHAASLGEYAPDAAVHEGRVEVVLVTEHGRRESYGRLIRRRRVGDYLVQLTDDAVRGMWWVVAVRVDPPRQVLIGFRHGRRADASHVLDHVTEDELDRGLGGQRS